MKTFIKLNITAFLYGILLFILHELLLNYYRIQRFIPYFNRKVIVILLLFIIITFTISLRLIFLKHFNNIKLRYLLTIFWIPYYIILIHIFSKYFPMTNPGDKPPNVLGLIIIFTYLIYPFYPLFININYFTTKNKQ